MFNKFLSGLGQVFKLLKPAAHLLRTFYRWVSPAADLSQSEFLRQLAVSIVQGWMAKHPEKAGNVIGYISELIVLLRGATPVTEETARTLIQAAIYSTSSAGTAGRK